MAFGTYEQSTESGRPIRLYRFTIGVRVWRYTSAATDLVIDGYTWASTAMTDSGVRQNGEAASESLTIDGPNSIGPAVLFTNSAPPGELSVEILTKHVDDNDLQVVYVGEVMQCNFPLPGQARLTCQSLSATMRRTGLRLTYQRACPFVLYDVLTCKVAESAWQLSGTVASIDGYTISVPALASVPDNKLAGGFLRWSDVEGLSRTLTIERQTGGTLVMFDDTSDLYPGATVYALPGCARTTDACKSFNNIENYGGFPYMPGRSPFDGISTPFF